MEILRDGLPPITDQPRYEGTVLEIMAGMEDTQPQLHRPGTPPPTPPTSIGTTTRSGEGFAQIADDQMTDHLYE